MNFIGKILPVDGYYIQMKGNLPADYAKSLTHLYQPLIGMQAVILYQTLLHEIELQTGSAQTHHTLMNYLNVPLDDIYAARRKLEGIGLLETYEQCEPAGGEGKYYLYELQSPFAPGDFFTDAMLSQLLYHHLGEAKFAALKQHYMKDILAGGDNITAAFGDVFRTFEPSFNLAVLQKENREDPAPAVQSIDFTWMEQMLRQRMIPAEKVLHDDNKKLIAQMQQVYDLASHELERAVLWALTEENTLDPDEFKAACHDLFKTQHHKTSIRLAEKAPVQPEASAEQPKTKAEQFINHLETISPKELLEDLSGGNQASEQDMRVVSEVLTQTGLPTPVMNVLIHYVMLQSNMKLGKEYLSKIASHWSRVNIKTAKEAMAFAKRETENRRKRTETKQNRPRRQLSNEVVPDWFKEREKKQNTTKAKEDKSGQLKDADKERAELLKLLRTHSKTE
jgi:replication initiation and membrane attachment protein